MELALAEATEPSGLSTINRLIHDHWFSVRDVEYDKAERGVRVKFARAPSAGGETIGRLLFLRRVRESVTEWLLEVQEVQGLTLRESEGVDRYDFNELVFTDPGGTLEVKTGIPLEFTMRVGRLRVVVRETSKVLRETVRLKL